MKFPSQLIACLLLFSCFMCVCRADDTPNIIVIYGDDIGYGDFSCYGGTGVATPNIDALASTGVRMTSAYCTAATCTPSRYSLLTGKYAFRNEQAQILPGNAPLIIDPKRPTVAEFLRSNGYSTALVGKWHLGLGSADKPLDWNGKISPGPNEVGFEYAFNMAATADRVPSVYIENGRIVGLDPDDPVQVSYQEMVGDEPTGITHPHLLKVQADKQHSCTIVNGVSRIGYMTGGKSARFKDEDMADTYLQKAIDFVRQKKSAPFFMYYAPNENHVPRVIHPRFQGSSSLGPRGDAIAVFDWCIGRLVKELQKQGVYENTLIIISSDNGPVQFDGYWDGAIEKQGDHKAAGPFRGGKYSRWEGGTRMPMVVSWPARVKPTVSDAIVSQVDLYASLAELIGKPMPQDAGPDSQNMLAAMLGEDQQGRDYVIQEALSQVAIRKGKWKYIPTGLMTERGGIEQWSRTNVDAPGWLFDLEADPGEQQDIAAEHPTVVAELKAIIEEVAPGKSTGEKLLNKKQLGF